MKIVYLSHGENVHDRRFLSKMVEYGHEPFLISYYGRNLVDIDGVKVYRYNDKWLYGLDRFINHFFNFQITKKIFAFQAARHLRKLLKEIKPDILHTNFIHYEGFCGALASFYPTVSMPWGSDILINPRVSLFDKLAAIFTLKRANMIVCDCEVVKQEIFKLANIPTDKISIVYCGVDLNIFNRNTSGNEIKETLRLHGKKILLMNRNYHPVYGIEYFIESLPKIIEGYPDVFVILIGDGPLKVKCERRINQLGIHNHVYFAGTVNEAEMVKYLNVADIYISTSLSDGTSLSLLEAFACGLPVVVTDIPANREWVEDGVNGYLVPVKNAKKITNAILKLLANNKIAKQFAERNFKIVREKADWDMQYQKLDGIYRELVDRKSGKTRHYFYSC